MSELEALALRCEAAAVPSKLRFSLCQGQGWVSTSDEATARLLCDLWNSRRAVAAALRASMTPHRPNSGEGK